jgi:hypothetical protein
MNIDDLVEEECRIRYEDMKLNYGDAVADTEDMIKKIQEMCPESDGITLSSKIRDELDYLYGDEE